MFKRTILIVWYFLDTIRDMRRNYVQYSTELHVQTLWSLNAFNSRRISDTTTIIHVKQQKTFLAV